MKKIIFSYMLMAMATLSYGEKSVSFTNQTGFAVIADVKGYEYSTRKINVEVQANALNTHLPKFVFSDTNKDLLKAIRVFCDPDVFRLSIEKNIGEWEPGRAGAKQCRFTFSMEFLNEGPVALNNIRMEYCDYRDILAKRQESVSRYVTARRIYQLGEIAPSKKAEFETSGSSLFESDTAVAAVAGICVRLYLPVSENYEVMREFRFPETLSPDMYPWGDFFEGKFTSEIP